MRYFHIVHIVDDFGIDYCTGRESKVINEIEDTEVEEIIEKNFKNLKISKADVLKYIDKINEIMKKEYNIEIDEACLYVFLEEKGYIK